MVYSATLHDIIFQHYDGAATIQIYFDFSQAILCDKMQSKKPLFSCSFFSIINFWNIKDVFPKWELIMCTQNEETSFNILKGGFSKK